MADIWSAMRDDYMRARPMMPPPTPPREPMPARGQADTPQMVPAHYLQAMPKLARFDYSPLPYKLRMNEAGPPAPEPGPPLPGPRAPMEPRPVQSMQGGPALQVPPTAPAIYESPNLIPGPDDIEAILRRLRQGASPTVPQVRVAGVRG